MKTKQKMTFQLKTKHIGLLLTALLLVVTACNKDNDDYTDITIYSTSSSSALVTQFRLQANTKVYANLDSVFFTIDPERKMIYNADSLPKGTNVSRLLTSVSFLTSVSEASFIATYTEDGKTVTDTIKYTDTSTDSINFTGKVILKVVSYDKNLTMDYDVHVNVHQSEPDSILWARSDRRDLPGSGNDNIAQRTVEWKDGYACLVQTGLGYKFSTADSPAGPWTTETIAWGFEPDVNSLAADEETLFVLDTDGNLLTSTDGTTWTATGQNWRTIIGTYDHRVLGITAGETPCHDEYPASEGFTPKPIEAQFPVSDLSQLITIKTDWAINEQALMVGGRLADGTLSADSWSYDGHSWQIVSGARSALPALRGAALIAYYTFDLTAGGHAVKKVTWLVMGGFDSTGTPNRVTYRSRDMGITWSKAASGLQLPDYIPGFCNAQAFVENATMTAASAAPRRVSKPSDEWECPYIYIFGGISQSGTLFNNIWRGALNRLRYKPVY